MTTARENFVNDNYGVATAATRGSGIFPEVLLTQAIVESQRNVNGVYTPGASLLSSKYNNYFGIKSSPAWTGKTVTLDTREFTNQIVKGIFRVYPSKTASFTDYVKFLKTNERYDRAGVFKATTPEAQIKAIAQAGYATDPNYQTVLLQVLAGVKEILKKKRRIIYPARVWVY